MCTIKSSIPVRFEYKELQGGWKSSWGECKQALDKLCTKGKKCLFLCLCNFLLIIFVAWKHYNGKILHYYYCNFCKMALHFLSIWWIAVLSVMCKRNRQGVMSAFLLFFHAYAECLYLYMALMLKWRNVEDSGFGSCRPSSVSIRLRYKTPRYY